MPILGEKHRFTRSNVELAPNAPGVYALYVGDEVAFYGAAGAGETIRSRLSEHLGGRQAPGRDAARAFSYEVTRFPMSRERALLEEHRRRTWRLPDYNQPERRADGRQGGLQPGGLAEDEAPAAVALSPVPLPRAAAAARP
jgi:hypothetical protein